ncbi:MAG: TetR/AcrR family transcriptional regulator [Myxococcota bacterium]
MARSIQEDKAELVRRRILEASFELVAENGLGRLRMGEVATRASCSRATLYRCFASKEDLLHGIFESEALRIIRELGPRILDEQGIAERLTEMVAGAVESVRETPHLRPFFEPEALSITLSAAASAPGLHQASVAFLQRVLPPGPSVRDGLDLFDVSEWLVRSVLSFLMFEGIKRRSAIEFRRQIRTFVVNPII